MVIKLRPYDSIPNYPEIFESNAKVIDSLQDYELIRKLISSLAVETGIDEALVSLSLKQFLVNFEYFPEYIDQAPGHADTKQSSAGSGKIQKYVRLVAKAVKLLFGNLVKRRNKLDVIIDDWSENVISNFYGKEMMSGMKMFRHKALQVIGIKNINIIDLIKRQLNINRVKLLVQEIKKEHALNLSRFVSWFFNCYYSGIAIKSKYSPKIIVSGNYNDFPFITGVASGAKILTIANARHTTSSCMTYEFADYHIAQARIDLMGVIERTRCSFGQLFCYGSLRLHNYNHENKNAKHEIEYDILWISEYEFDNKDLDERWKGYFSTGPEEETIKMLNYYAGRKDLKIAYKCRKIGEIEKLKERGLLSNKIKYIGRWEQNTYGCMQKARLVLSSVSSAVNEAILAGTEGAYVNLTGNDYLNDDVRDLEIEYTVNSSISIDEFISKHINEKRDYKRYFWQNPNYVQDALKIISSVVKGEPVIGNVK